MPSIAPAAKRSRVYYTGLVPFVEQRLQKEIRGRGWSMKMGIRPDKCRHDYKSTRPSQHYSPAQPEIVICARDIHRADAALALFMD